MKIQPILLLCLLLSVACSQTAVPTATPRPTATVPTPFPTATLAPPTNTPLPPGTPLPDATSTPLPTDTPVPTATPTAGPHAPDVEQPPYTESPCSDRFPCFDDTVAWEERIQVPPGFQVTHFAHLPNPDPEASWPTLLPTSITFGPDGKLYVATKQGSIYTIDSDGSQELFFDGLITPTGIAFQPGTDRLYVSSRVQEDNVHGEGQIITIENGQAAQIIGGIPCCYMQMHGPHGIAFGVDGYGYVGVGGRADHGEILDGSNTQDEMHPWEGTILRFNPDGSEVEVYARGFRNPYDIAWAADGKLYATDNGRDEDASIGERVPEELHEVIPGGEHGYPYYECPVCYGIPEGIEVISPIYEFEPHAVPVGIIAYLDDQFPGYFNSLFIPLWTADAFAERVIRYTLDGQGSTFAAGFSAPIDVTVGPEGDLFVADYYTGIIFKISFTG